MARILISSTTLLVVVACSGKEPAATPSPPLAQAPSAAPTLDSPEPLMLAPLSAGGTSLCPNGKIEECARRCEAGNALSCARLAQAKPEEARSTWARSCELGYAVACVSFAEMLALGVGGPSHVKLARRLFATACKLEVARGCYGAAVLQDDAGLAMQSFRRACELGDPMACVEAPRDGDTKGRLRGMRRALQGAPSNSTAAKALDCPDGAHAFETASFFGAVELFCARPSGEKHGPFIAWASREDLVQGGPDGVVRERGSYASGHKEGTWEAWDLDGKFRSKGSFRRGREHGDWELVNGSGYLERGRFDDGLREGPWKEERGLSTIDVSYVRGKREGKLVDRSNSGGLTTVEEWHNGMRQGTQTRTWEGTQTCVTRFVDDKKVGESVCRDPKGRVIP